jgi:hypothetical protein
MLAKVAEAMGGEAKLGAVKDLTEKAELTLDASAGGLRAAQTELWLAPGYYREEDVLPFGKLITYSDGATGWFSSPQGMGPVPEQERAQIAFEIFRKWFPLMLSGHDVNRTVTEADGGRIQVSDKNGNSVTIGIDAKTSLPLTETYSQPGAPGNTIEERFSDWQETSGVKLPHQITLIQNGKHFADIHVLSVNLNQGITVDQISKKP